MNVRQNTNKKYNAGAVLLMVMGLIMMLSFLLGSFLNNVMKDFYRRSQMFGTAELRQQAYNALDATLAVLTEIKAMEGELYSPLQGWQHPIEFSKLTSPEEFIVSATVSDETGKIPINASDARTIEHLMSIIGLDTIDAPRATTDFIKWRDQKDTQIDIFIEDVKNKHNTRKQQNQEQKTKHAKADSNATKNTNILPNGLMSYQQLAEIENIKKLFFDKIGIGTEKLEGFIKNTSIHSIGPININTVNSDVLSILAKQFNIDHEQIEKFLGLVKSEGIVPKFYRSLDEISKMGHGRFTTTQNKNTDKAANSKQQKPIVDVVARILKVDIKVQKADIVFNMTAILSNNSTKIEENKAKEDTKAQPQDKNAQNDHLTKHQNKQYNNTNKTSKAGTIEVISITEGGPLL